LGYRCQQQQTVLAVRCGGGQCRCGRAGAANRALLCTRDLSTAASARPCCAPTIRRCSLRPASEQRRVRVAAGLAGVVLQCRRRVCGPQSLGLELARGPCGCACPGPVPATAIFSPKTQSTPPAIPERNPTRCAPFSLPPHPRLSPASALTLAASLSSRRSTTTPAPACRLPPAACCLLSRRSCRACACRALTTTTRRHARIPRQPTSPLSPPRPRRLLPSPRPPRPPHHLTTAPLHSSPLPPPCASPRVYGVAPSAPRRCSLRGFFAVRLRRPPSTHAKLPLASIPRIHTTAAAALRYR
jgi:hypothetical protein